MLFQAVLNMRESVTYQAILEEGRLEEVRNILLLQGRDRLGEPSAKIIALAEQRGTPSATMSRGAVRTVGAKTGSPASATTPARVPR